jgi:hypothetical protein
MTTEEFLQALISATSLAEATHATQVFVESNAGRTSWAPVGGRPNNRGIIEVSADPGRSLVERLTNAVDAVLEAEHDIHNGLPICNSPKEAALAWLNVPSSGLGSLTPSDRRTLAALCTIRLLPGEGRNSRLVEIRDEGIGLAANEMPRTILSLNESNKIEKRYLAGTYGQGGSSTFAITRLTLIATRRHSTDQLAFSLVRYEDLPAERWKTGNYVYLVLDNAVLRCTAAQGAFRHGTLVKHFGYDLSAYPSPVGPRSVYGLLNRVLFDPVLPIWLDNQIHRYRRVIKGSRNALNGAVDEGDEEAKGPTLTHNVRLYFVDLSDFGRIGIEYWVLESPTKAKRRPSEAFVNPAKPIVLTQNGQNHAELSQLIVRKDAELPYLAQRLICHIDCNSLTPEAKRALFVSSREDARFGVVRDLIEAELVKALKSDDELRRLNEEAKQQGLRERDEDAARKLKREVARLLRVHGLAVPEEGSGPGEGDSPKGPRGVKRRPRTPPPPLEVHEPPTYLKIVWEEERIDFFGGQRRYIRLETDANASYHDPTDPHASHINFIVDGLAIRVCGSTSLERGRLRVVLECTSGETVGALGRFRVELQRPGLAMLSDQRTLRIVPEPKQRVGPSKIAVPSFDVRPVAPDDDLWTTLGWPESVEVVASDALMEAGILVIYYSTAFPGFERQRETWERKDPDLAESFTRRYEVWLAVHSLLYHQDQQKRSEEEGSVQNQLDDGTLFEQAERRRVATVASFMASSEIASGELASPGLSEDHSSNA